jgi:hypothetical protein
MPNTIPIGNEQRKSIVIFVALGSIFTLTLLLFYNRGCERKSDLFFQVRHELVHPLVEGLALLSRWSRRSVLCNKAALDVINRGFSRRRHISLVTPGRLKVKNTQCLDPRKDPRVQGSNRDRGWVKTAFLLPGVYGTTWANTGLLYCIEPSQCGLYRHSQFDYNGVK